MQINVIGGKPSQRKYVESIAAYCVRKFLPRHRNLEVEIKLKNFGKDATHGYCLQADEREYEIEVNRSLRLRDLLITVAHEMVHVKQYVKHEFLPNESDIEYWDRPTEIEAHGRETGLFIRWAEENNLGKNAWTQLP